MQKYKMSLILYSSAISVFYGVTTASAAPFRDFVREFMVESSAVVTQLVSNGRDFDFKSGASVATGPIVFDSGKLDPIAAFVSEIRRDYPTSNELDATSDRSEPGLGAFGSQRFTSQSPLNGATPLDARNDLPIRFVIDGKGFPDGNYPRIKKPKYDPDKIPAKDTKDAEPLPTPSDPELYVILPDVDELIDIPNGPDEFSLPDKIFPVDNTPFTPNAPILIVSSSSGAVQTIPEAATLALLGLGVAGLGFIRRRPAKGALSRS